MDTKFFYDPWTRFLENLWDNHWSHAEFVDKTIKEQAAFEIGLRRLQRESEIDPIKGMPWLVMNDGSRRLVPVAGAEDYPLKALAAWTPFGINFPYIGSAADNAALSGNMAAQYQQYRDVKLTGTLTAALSPQIMVCRNLDLNGNTINGPIGGVGSAGAASPGGGFGGLFTSSCTVVIAPSATVPYDITENLFALGGAGGANNAIGSAGASAAALNILSAISMYYMMIGCTGGGGGGGGSSSTTGGSARLAGRRGCAGQGAAAGAGGAGGSGIGGGGGGGGGPTAGAGTATAGGNGGGILIVICERIFGTVGTIAVNGVTATNVSVTNAGGGGGGGGGIALVFCPEVITTPTLTATHGNGGTAGGGASGKAGGNGGDGLVAVVNG